MGAAGLVCAGWLVWLQVIQVGRFLVPDWVLIKVKGFRREWCERWEWQLSMLRSMP
jgi:hypothetical protein